MNKVELFGRVTKDIEMNYTTGDNKIAIVRFNLAVKRNSKEEASDFISCKALGKLAEALNKYISKGDRLCLTGSWQTGSYEKDGTKIYTNECLINEVEFVETKKDKEENKLSNDNYSESDYTDDDLPF